MVKHTLINQSIYGHSSTLNVKGEPFTKSFQSFSLFRFDKTGK